MTAAVATACEVQRAIFTAIRSPMGVGYRIVTASPGITSAEQREIVRGAPSHGSLCDNTPDATALASFPLSTGRHCLLLSMHAGPEQTARGGYRVLTHVLVLEPEQFERFACDPLQIEHVALNALGAARTDVPLTPLAPLTLRCRRTTPRMHLPAHATRDNHVGGVLAGLAAVFGDGDVVMLDAPTPREALRIMLLAMPVQRRRTLSLSCGLKSSPARPFALVLTSAGPAEQRRIASESRITLIDWAAPEAPALDGPARTWLDFVRTNLTAGHFDQAARIAAALGSGDLAVAARAVRLIDEAGRVEDADDERLDALTREWLDPPAGGLPQYLLDDLRLAILKRRGELERIAAEQRAAEERAREAAEAAAQADNEDLTPDPSAPDIEPRLDPEQLY